MNALDEFRPGDTVECIDLTCDDTVPTGQQILKLGQWYTVEKTWSCTTFHKDGSRTHGQTLALVGVKCGWHSSQFCLVDDLQAGSCGRTTAYVGQHGIQFS